ncbi:hydroxyacylglutathione hydrolase [Rheinheimera sp.]|uniref:hydroxyacylglutathione hydrolase n=1 Tax=Rheinheimera sp. TaxID=1869214 RepID=UPI0027B9CBE0|nr:hydroxyacylglutathione hydrolase [Rheinheimera sp.]
MYHITAIAAFKDNYIWCLHHQGKAVLVDPGDASVVSAFLTAQKLSPVAILITHHHWDHVDGIPALQQLWPELPVYIGAAERAKTKHQLQHCHIVSDNMQFLLPQVNLTFSVLAVPGHTLGHMAYLCQPPEQPPVLFCGDTLFSAGCGRLFEGSHTQMYQSLQKINALSPQTRIYCTHEYTMANLKFALEVEPDNLSIVEHQHWCETQGSANQPTLPSSIEKERQINPYLRCDNTALQQRWQQQDAVALFSFIRLWKDRY